MKSATINLRPTPIPISKYLFQKMEAVKRRSAVFLNRYVNDAPPKKTKVLFAVLAVCSSVNCVILLLGNSPLKVSKIVLPTPNDAKVSVDSLNKIEFVYKNLIKNKP